MKKVMGYLKPFIFSLICCLVLLFVQAMCDLNLPNYMSDIVNIGLQQSGIENVTPEAIGVEGYQFITTFMTEEEKSSMQKSYDLVTSKKASKKQQKAYPLVKEKDIYVLNQVGKDQLEELEQAIRTASMTMLEFMKSQAQDQIASENTSNTSLDITKMYSMLPMLQQIPKEQLESYRKSAEQYDASMLTQTGIVFTKSFYQEVGINLTKMQSDYILIIGIKMLLISLLGAVASVLVGFLASRLSSGVARNLRADIFKKVESFAYSELKQYGASSLITRTTNDVTQVQNLFMMGIRMICYAPIMGVGGILMALRKSTSMGWIIAVACIVLIGLILCIFAIAMPKFKKLQKLIDKLNLIARENLNGLLVIRAFGTQTFEEKRFDSANQEFAKTNLFINRVMTFMMPAMMFIMNGVTILIVWVGAHQIENAAMQVGDMMAFMQYSMQIIMAFLMISMMFIMVPRASVSAARIAEVLKTNCSVLDPENAKEFDSKQTGTVEFKHVYFQYPDAEASILRDISFVAKKGETTAFIGSTGSGKSTLIDLVPRFYDVTKGEILVNGVNVKEVKKHDLRERIGYVPQKGVLHSGTIQSNLTYGKENASLEEMNQAIEVAQAKEFIAEKELGLDTPIAQGGGNVSGGQKQRLSIARALIKKPDVYIFDDSFSALDFKTDAKLRSALKEYTKDSTVLIVAQRVSTIMHAEQIIVLEEGQVVGKGTHEELLKNCPTYYEIAASQLSKEELM